MNAFSKMLIEFTATRHTSENWKGAVIDFLFLHAHARESKIAKQARFSTPPNTFAPRGCS